MRPARTAFRLIALGTVVVTVLAGAPATAAAPRATGPVVAGGVTQPVFDYTQAIRERVLVETAVDSDGDGRRDRVEVRIIRPKETDAGLRSRRCSSPARTTPASTTCPTTTTSTG